MPKSFRSSAWARDVEGGLPYVLAGPPCPACRTDTAAYYRVGRVCADCAAAGRRGRRRRAPHRPRPATPTLGRLVLPYLPPEVTAQLPRVQHRVYVGLLWGLNLTQIATIRRTSVEATSRTVGRLVGRLRRMGLMPTG